MGGEVLAASGRCGVSAIRDNEGERRSRQPEHIRPWQAQGGGQQCKRASEVAEERVEIKEANFVRVVIVVSTVVFIRL